MIVKDVMTAQVVTAKPSTTVSEIARMMSQIDSGAVPIVDDGKAVGLITDRDIVLRVVAKGAGLDTPAAEVMSDGVVSCKEDDNVAAAAAKMGAEQVRRLLVYNEAGGLAGIVSLGDIALDYGAKVVGRTLEEISEEPADA